MPQYCAHSKFLFLQEWLTLTLLINFPVEIKPPAPPKYHFPLNKKPNESSPSHYACIYTLLRAPSVRVEFDGSCLPWGNSLDKILYQLDVFLDSQTIFALNQIAQNLVKSGSIKRQFHRLFCSFWSNLGIAYQQKIKIKIKGKKKNFSNMGCLCTWRDSKDVFACFFN